MNSRQCDDVVPLVGTAGAARILGLSVERVKQLHRAGTLSAFRTAEGARSVRLFLGEHVEALARERAGRKVREQSRR